jgi:hypothetical protein
MDVGFTYNRNTFVGQKGICTAGHDVKRLLKSVPALNGNGIAFVFLSEVFHRDLKACDPADVLLRDAYFHIVVNEINGIGHFFIIGGFKLFNPVGKLDHRDREELYAEFFEKLTFVHHHGPEIARSGINLKDARLVELLHDV